MAEIPPIALRIILETGQVVPAATQVEGALEGIGAAAEATNTKTTGLMGGMKNLSGAVKGFVAFEAVKFLIDAGKAAAEDNRSFAEMSRTMVEATGASKAQVAGVDKQIQSLAQMSAVMDDQIRPSFDVLVRSTHDSSKALALQKIALDVSAGTGRDLTSITQAMAKAYEGNTTALNKLVPSVKGAKDPLMALQKQFDGAAKSAANQDPFKRLQQTFDELKETLGKALMPIFQTLANVLTKLSPILNKVANFVGEVVAAVMPLVDSLLNALSPVLQTVMDLLLPLIRVALIPLKAILPPIAGLFKGIADVLNVTLVPAFKWLGDLLNGFVNNAIKGLQDAFKHLADFLGPIWNNILKPIIDGMASLFHIKISASADVTKPADSGYTGGAYTGGAASGGGAGGAGSAAKKAETDLATAKSVLAKTHAAVVAAQNTYSKAVYDAYGTYNKQVANITQQRNDALTALEKDHADKLLGIQRDYASKLQGIVQQSMDLLRGAFSQVASIDVGSMFAENLAASDLSSVVATQMKGGIQTAVSYWGSPSASGGVAGLISNLQSKLDASKKLVDNSAALSGAGFSQNFIQQIVAQGTNMGNKMADAILAATPEQQKQLEALFEANQTTAATGMDSLAKTIYDKSGLATDGLKKLYASTQAELTQALADEQQAYVDQTKQINDTFTKGLADAHTALVGAINDAGVALNSSLDKIAADMSTKLSKVKGVLGKVSGQVANTQSLITGSYATGATAPLIPGFAVSQNQAAAATSGQNVTNNYYNIATDIATDADPNAYVQGVTNAIKFGSPIMVAKI